MRKLLLLSFMIGGVSLTARAVSVIQSNLCTINGTTCGGGCTATCAFNSNIGAHHTLIVNTVTAKNPAPALSASDSFASFTTLPGANLFGGSTCCSSSAFIRGSGNSSGADTVSIINFNCTSTLGSCQVAIWEVDVGGDEGFVLNSPSGNNCESDSDGGSVTSLTCNANAVSGNLMLGIGFAGNGSTVAGSGYTLNTNGNYFIEYKTAGSTGAIAVNATFTSSNFVEITGLAVPVTPVSAVVSRHRGFVN